MDHNTQLNDATASGSQQHLQDSNACVLEKQPELSVLALSGDLTVALAGTVKDRFLDAIRHNQPIALHLGDLRKVDIAILQLFHSLNITAERANLPLEIKSLSDSVADLIRTSGFIGEYYHPVPDRSRA